MKLLITDASSYDVTMLRILFKEVLGAALLVPPESNTDVLAVFKSPTGSLGWVWVEPNRYSLAWAENIVTAEDLIEGLLDEQARIADGAEAVSSTDEIGWVRVDESYMPSVQGQGTNSVNDYPEPPDSVPVLPNEVRNQRVSIDGQREYYVNTRLNPFDFDDLQC